MTPAGTALAASPVTQPYDGDVVDNGGGPEVATLGSVGYISAVTNGQVVSVNPNGNAFNNVSKGGSGIHILQSVFDKFGISQRQYAFAVIIHGGQIVAELDGNAVWQRGYVYAGNNLMAVQQGGVFWTYEDPVTKSKRVCDVNGNIVSSVELDPWGADTNRSANAAFQPRKYTTYDRDGNGSDEAMFRRYNRKHSRFDQPDPYDGSSSLTNPQSFNRYSYVQNDPVNLVDPTGLFCVEWVTYENGK